VAPATAARIATTGPALPDLKDMAPLKLPVVEVDGEVAVLDELELLPELPLLAELPEVPLGVDPGVVLRNKCQII
jgi:hypothetical protein